MLSEKLGFINIKEFFNKTRKLKTDILFASLSVLSISIILIIAYTYYSSSNAIVNQAKNHLRTSATSLKDKVVTALQDAESVVKIYEPLLRAADLDKINSDIFLISSMIETLNIYPHLTTVYVGSAQGLFWELGTPKTITSYLSNLGLNIPEDTTGVIKVIRNKIVEDIMSQSNYVPQTNEEWYYIQDSKKISGPYQGERTGYDHRKRGWYITASKTQNLQWSDIYVFATTLRGSAGITAAKSIIDSKGALKGVIATDITLKSFSELLSQVKASTNSVTYIIDEKKQIVANSALKSNVIVKDNNYKLLTVQDLEDPILAKTIEKYELNNNNNKEGIIFLEINNQGYIAYFHDFPKLFKNEWRIVVISPLNDFIGIIKENQKSIFAYSVIILLVSFILSYRLARRISRPIMTIVDETKKIQKLEFDGKPTVLNSRIKEITDLSSAINSLKTTIHSFSYYIPKSLVHKLLSQKQLIHVGGRAKEVTLMFTDIANFTNISEGIPPEKLVVYLSEYFEELSSIIMENDGTIDKYIGDAIMAFWGAPLTDRHHIFNACRSALVCQKRLTEINRVWKREGRPVFNTRIGLHLGEAVVGNIGSSERMNYTAIGDSVNLSSRLEGLNKVYGTNVIASESVYNAVKDHFLFRSLDYVAVKGKKQPVKIFELLGQIKGDDSLYPSDEQIEYCAIFEKAISFYTTRQWKEALKIFESLNTPYNQHDLAVKVYIDRCNNFIKTPPPKDWDRSYTMKEK